MHIKLIKNNFGMTLTELLGSILILIIIASLTFPILFNGVKSSNHLQNETKLRDEADYLMASLIKELYTTKETDIMDKQFPEIGTINYYIVNKNENKMEITGFFNNTLIVAGNEITLTNKTVTLLPSKIIDLGEGQYKIILNLKYEGRISKKMEFINIVRTIYDEDAKKGGTDS